MANLIDIITKDSVNRSLALRMCDSTDGTPETGVTSATPGLDVWYRREGGLKVSLTESDLSLLSDAHADGGLLHVSDGEYRVDFPDAAFSTGAQYVDVGWGATGMVGFGGRVRLVDYDLETALPTNFSSMGIESDGHVHADVKEILGVAQSVTDLKDFADEGYDPATNKVQGVVLVDTTTTNSDMRGTDNAALAAKLIAYVQLLSRNDAAIETDNAAELTEINADGGSGGGSYSSISDSVEAIRDHIGDGTNLSEAGGTGDHLTSVPWNAAWDAEVQSECTDALNAYDPPTNAEMEARTLVAASYFDPAADTVANVTTVTTVSGNVTGSVGSLATQAKADVNAEVDAALTEIHLDRFFAAAYDPANKPGAADAWANELVENDGGVTRFTANALEQGPSGAAGGSVSTFTGDAADQLDAIQAKTDTIGGSTVCTSASGTGSFVSVACDIRSNETPLWTYHDVLDHLTDHVGADTGGRAQKMARRSILAAYRVLPQSHNWRYYYKRGRIVTAAPYTTGTVAYDHTGSTYEREVTLSSGTWPTWAARGVLRIGNVDYDVAERKSDTIVTLSVNSNPGADVSSGTSYTLFRESYTMPLDFHSAGKFSEINTNFWWPSYVTPDQWLLRHASQETTNNPRGYTFMADPDYQGALAAYFYPAPDAEREFDFIYQRTPLPLRNLDYSTGTVSNTGAAVTGTGTTWTEALVGSVIRFGDNQHVPSGIDGLHPYVDERIVTRVSSNTSLEVDAVPSKNHANVKYRMSDPIDIEQGSMLDAFLAYVEYRMSVLTKDSDVKRKEGFYFQSLGRAMAADNRDFGDDSNRYNHQHFHLLRDFGQVSF